MDIPPLWTVTQLLSEEAVKTRIQAFVSCQLDYCNGLLYDVADNRLRRLQLAQNESFALAASLPTSHIKDGYDRVQITLYAPYGIAVAYLADDCQHATGGHRRLRSSTSHHYQACDTTFRLVTER